jgi:glycosyltransferase involved in cell wall biosynthesis
MGPHVERLARIAPGRMRPFPNIVANATALITPRPPRPALVSVATLDRYRQKGIDRLIRAVGAIAPRHPDVTLDIFGPASAGTEAELTRQIAAAGLEGRVRLMGEARNADLVAALPNYLALALPSRAETFGMVYTEALFAGIPILYARGTGIDGYLDGIDCGIGVDADDVGAIAGALERLVAGNAALRGRIAAGANELFRRFDPTHHLALYRADIAELAGTAGAAAALRGGEASGVPRTANR